MPHPVISSPVLPSPVRAGGLAALLCLLPAPQDAPRASWRDCAATIPWEHAIEVPNGEALLGELVMSGRLAAWSREWIRAALAEAPSLEELLAVAAERRRPLLWYVPTVEGQQMILPHLLDRQVEIGALADPMVTTLLARRFVAIKRPGGGQEAADLGLRAPDFVEPGLLVFAPDGSLVRRIDRLGTFQPEWTAAFLRGVLRELGDAAPPGAAFLAARAAVRAAPADVDAVLRLAQEALAEGELEAGESALEALPDSARTTSPRAAEIALAGARLARARQDDPTALAALAAARAARPGPALLAEVDALEGLVLLGLGQDARAEPLLRRAATGDSEGCHEAAWALGALLHLSARDAEARAVWNDLALSAPDSLFAARADACVVTAGDGLQGEAPLVRAQQDVRWLPPEATAAAAAGDVHPAAERETLVRRGLTFLLRQQRDDGSWRGTHWGGDGEEAPAEPEEPEDDEAVLGGLGVFWNVHTAITAQGAAALLAWRAVEPERTAAALERAERFLLADAHVVRGGAVLWVYADALRVMHFARRHPDPAARPAEVQAAMERWIENLVAHQDETGGPFLHYTYPSTFVTACVLLCLAEARDAGCAVPERCFTRGADAIAAARGGEEGLFGYLLEAPAANRTPAGAAARQALCVWALHRAGRGSTDDVARAIELYLRHYPLAAAAGRASNFHVPELDFQAGYFFFHDLWATCLATRDAGAAGPELRRRLERLLVALPEPDGSFVDAAFSYGKAYGTAMALAALAALR